jgi:aryl-alcohol dehydrogenase-like predicted oxidoreductase
MKGAASVNTPAITTESFGEAGPIVTRVGLGGEGVLRTHGRQAEAAAVIEEAIRSGITYFDCARAYAGSEGYYGRIWSAQPEARRQVFQAGKSAMRTRDGALADLERTLRNMAIDYLDLWQIHDVRTEADLRAIAERGGALEAFVQAKAEGKVRFIGVTGHHAPAILTRAVQEWPVDAVMMPVNPVEAVLGGFLDTTLPAAREKGIAVIAMKVLGASHFLAPQAGIGAEVLIRFALSQPVTVAIVGCSTPEHVRILAHAGANSQPLSSEEMAKVIQLYRPHARDLACYRGTR